MAWLRKQLAMQVTLSQALTRHCQNATHQAGLAQEALLQTKKLLEQALLSLKNQQDTNCNLVMQLEALETRQVDSHNHDVDGSAL
ncbi:hypothetical protein EDD85DRAFT_956410 [Armillaria nabsnona]|nr:hypothetical protein EDD85DRAFT_956410 [Armillaria nabsnona]